MRSTSALIVVGLGVLLLYLGATGKLDNIGNAWASLRGVTPGTTGTAANPASTTAGSSQLATTILAALPSLGLSPLPPLSGSAGGGSAAPSSQPTQYVTDSPSVVNV